MGSTSIEQLVLNSELTYIGRFAFDDNKKREFAFQGL